LSLAEQKYYNACAAIDSQITVDVHVQGVIPKIFQAARRQSKFPLTLNAGEKLRSAGASQGSTIFLLTGFPVPYPFAKKPNEVHSDGPVGIASLAAALVGRYNARVFVITDEGLEEIVRGCLDASFGSRSISNSTQVIALPKNVNLDRECDQLIRDHKPNLLISSEKPGRNSKGEFHSIAGLRLTQYVSQADKLFDFAAEKKISTIAIGDVGNEIGMRSIESGVTQALPRGGACSCPCNGSIVSGSNADAILLGTMSDWGVYGLMAWMGLEQKDPSVLPDSDELVTILNAFARNSNLKDWTQLMTDDISMPCTVSCLEILKHIIVRSS
jgi:hypothetical protein